MMTFLNFLRIPEAEAEEIFNIIKIVLLSFGGICLLFALLFVVSVAIKPKSDFERQLDDYDQMVSLNEYNQKHNHA